jgi:alpha-aminoadipic semialdehyde synthase
MGVTIGIRREDKNEWERRVPLTPFDLATLAGEHDLEFIVQPSPIRVFGDAEYAAAGAQVAEDLSPASLVLAVKEIPVAELLEKRTYLYFSHTSKGQAYNMPMLQHLLDVGATLIDYERIADEQNRRLVFFSLHAGYAGAIETLLALGQRLAASGLATPLLEIRHAYQYADLEAALTHLREIGGRIAAAGLGSLTEPVIVGIAGYGNVAKGCRVILDCLSVREIPVSGLAAAAEGSLAEYGPLVAVVFKEEDMVVPRSSDAQFVLQDYYQRPANYRSVFENHLARLDVLLNCIFWTPAYPRLVTRKWVKAHYGAGKTPRLKVIGDISCDIEGGVEVTLKTTMPDRPCFVYEAESGEAVDGIEGNGPVIMAVDNLPCELPRESSEHFGSVLRGMVPALAQADFAVDFEGLHLPSHLKKAVITHRGQLTPKYRYLQEYLDRSGK